MLNGGKQLGDPQGLAYSLHECRRERGSISNTWGSPMWTKNCINACATPLLMRLGKGMASGYRVA